MRTITAAIIITGVLASPIGIDTALAEQLTGCLDNSNRLVKLAIGEQPSQPCTGSQIQVTVGGPQVTEPIFVTLQAGEEATIAINGPLEVFARCGPEVVDVIVISSVAGWVQTATTPNQPADQEVLLASATKNLTDPAYIAAFPNSGGSAAAPDGSYIGLGTLGLGLHILGVDCVVTGTVIVFDGDLLP